MSALLEKAVKVLQAAGERNESLHVSEINLHIKGYAEPGYTDPASGIIATGDWNNDQRYDGAIGKCVNTSSLPERLLRIFKHYGIEIEWSDEWCACDDCGKLFRTSADSYGWTAYYAELDDCRVCGDCLKNDPEAYIQNLLGDETKAETIGVDLEAAGYVKVIGDLENGFHPGQDDSPAKIAEALRARRIECFIFRIESVGQFDINFSCFIHRDSLETFRPLGDDEGKCDIAPNVALEAALRSFSIQSKALEPSDGIIIGTGHSDGTATVKVVTQQEFIEGRAR